MKKNRIIAGIWFAVIILIIVAMIAYVIYAAKNNPYFGTKNEATKEIVSFFTLRYRGVA